MSVDDPRPAAAQRTAARHVRLLATWLFIVPMLSFFSFSVVAGAKTFEKPDVKKAVSRLPDTRHVIEVAAGSAGDTGSTTPKALVDRFTHASHYVCSVGATTLQRIQQRYRTGRFALDLGDRSLDVVSVYDAGEQDLRSYLGTQQLTCVLVRVSSTFFLPFDAHTS